jgi:hypothetical protein
MIAPFESPKLLVARARKHLTEFEVKQGIFSDKKPYTILKTRFSQFAREPLRNQEYASRLDQRLDDEAEPVIAQREALILQ